MVAIDLKIKKGSKMLLAFKKSCFLLLKVLHILTSSLTLNVFVLVYHFLLVETNIYNTRLV